MRTFNLVVPLSGEDPATAMRATDTGGQLALFEPAASGAVSPLIGANTGLRRGDVDSTNGPRTPSTTTMPGSRTSRTAIRTTTTSRIRTGSSSSADQSAARDAGFSFEELVAAYIDCRRTKRRKASALSFESTQETGLHDLYAELVDGTWQPGRSTCFVITRPKPREVWAAEFRDRIVHHLLYNRIGAAIERTFIADSCACITGRGTLYGARRLDAKIRAVTANWRRPAFYLKLDLANFFVTIDKNRLRDRLAARIRDPWWLRLAEIILYNDPRETVLLHGTRAQLALVPPHKSLFNAPADTGLPIGNLSSQFFANIHLDALDQHVKHQLRVRHYIRYVDDMVLLHESPQQLAEWHADIAAFLPEHLGLALNPAKTILQPIDRGLDFVGQVIKPWRRLLRRRTLNEAVARIRRADLSEIYASANSYLGLARQATHSHADRARICRELLGRGLSVNHRFTKTYRAGRTHDACPDRNP